MALFFSLIAPHQELWSVKVICLCRGVHSRARGFVGEKPRVLELGCERSRSGLLFSLSLVHGIRSSAL